MKTFGNRIYPYDPMWATRVSPLHGRRTPTEDQLVLTLERQFARARTTIEEVLEGLPQRRIRLWQ